MAYKKAVRGAGRPIFGALDFFYMPVADADHNVVRAIRPDSADGVDATCMVLHTAADGGVI